MQTTTDSGTRVRRVRKPPGDNLAAARIRAMMEVGVDQTYFAERWGVRRPTVSQIVNGHARAYELELDMAAVLGKSHADLFPPATERMRANLSRAKERGAVRTFGEEPAGGDAAVST